MLYLASSLPLTEGRAGTTWENLEPHIFSFPPIAPSPVINIFSLTTYRTLFFFLLPNAEVSR
jgi:hypothetical protein